MKYSENLNLKLPEGGDTLEVSDLSENFEALDGAVGEAVKNADPYKVGDTLTTWRTDLGENWLLCNGTLFDGKKFPELSAASPRDAIENFSDGMFEAYIDPGSEGAPSFNGAGSDLMVVGSNILKLMVVDNYVWLLVQDLMKNGKFILKITSASGGTLPSIGTPRLAYVDDLYVVSFFEGSSTTSRSICAAMCHGDPLLQDNWTVYHSDSKHANDEIEGVLYIDGIYTLVGGSKRYQVVSFNPFSLVEYQNPGFADAPFTTNNGGSKNICINNRIYRFVYVEGPGTDNISYTVYLAKLRQDYSAFDVTPVYTGGLKKYSGTFKYSASTRDGKIVAFLWVTYQGNKIVYFEYDPETDGIKTINVSNEYNNSMLNNINNITEVDGFIVNKSGSFGTIKIYRNMEDIISNNFYKEMSASSSDYLGGVYSTPVKSFFKMGDITVLPIYSTNSFAVGLSGDIVPSISLSSAYTYIKAKEDTPNANQQTDTPAP